MDCRDFDPQLCIVQLTDFHFKELQGNYQKRVDDILVTIKKSIKSGTVLLLVTGDVARTGKESEYQSAAMFFDYLIEQLNQPEYQLKVYILPGNHDLHGPCKSIEYFSGEQYDLDLDYMASFYEFASKYNNEFVLGQPQPIVFEVEGHKPRYLVLIAPPYLLLMVMIKGFTY